MGGLGGWCVGGGWGVRVGVGGWVGVGGGGVGEWVGWSLGWLGGSPGRGELGVWACVWWVGLGGKLILVGPIEFSPPHA